MHRGSQLVEITHTLLLWLYDICETGTGPFDSAMNHVEQRGVRRGAINSNIAHGCFPKSEVASILIPELAPIQL